MSNREVKTSVFFANGNYYIEVAKSIIPNYPDVTSGSFSITIKDLDIIDATFHYEKDTIIDIGNNVRKSVEQCLPSQSYGSVYIKIIKRERKFKDIIKFSKMRLANIMRSQRDTSGVKIYSAKINFK